MSGPTDRIVLMQSALSLAVPQRVILQSNNLAFFLVTERREQLLRMLLLKLHMLLPAAWLGGLFFRQLGHKTYEMLMNQTNPVFNEGREQNVCHKNLWRERGIETFVEGIRLYDIS